MKTLTVTHSAAEVVAMLPNQNLPLTTLLAYHGFETSDTSWLDEELEWLDIDRSMNPNQAAEYYIEHIGVESLADEIVPTEPGVYIFDMIVVLLTGDGQWLYAEVCSGY